MSEKASLTVLYVEDNHDDAMLMQRSLASVEEFRGITIIHADDLRAAHHAGENWLPSCDERT